MKKIIFILGLAAVVLGTSCSDVLDLNPADRFSPATVWSTTTTADKYVIGLYSIFGQTPRCAAAMPMRRPDYRMPIPTS